MYKRPSKRKKLVRLITVYAVMVIAIISITTFVILLVLGFRFNRTDGHVEQYSLLQFNSSPSGATVILDGQKLNSKTPCKASVPAGTHTVTISKSGYKNWVKTVNVNSGVVGWLNYTLLVPDTLTIEPVGYYGAVHSTFASPDGHFILLQGSVESPSFELINISSDKIKTTSLVIPTTLYSEAGYYNVSHSFNVYKWDKGERYVLIKHQYGEKTEWLVLDTQNVEQTRNVSEVFSSPVDNIDFLGSGGNVFYLQSQSNIYKLELSSKAISGPLISGVKSFKLYDQSNTISYVAANETEQYVGIYRDGDEKPYILQTEPVEPQLKLNIAISHYFDNDYVAITKGQAVNVLGGNYPDSEKDVSISLKKIAIFNFEKEINELSFSPNGQYVIVRNADSFESYDLEYKTASKSSIIGSGPEYSMNWLDNSHLWTMRDGKLKISDFDGENLNEINATVYGQDITLTDNGRYLYSIGKTDSGFQLQRARLILP